MTDQEKLQEPFDPIDIEWRIGRSGEKNNNLWATALAYVSNRAIQNRLDEVFGCMFWKNEFKEWHESSQICGISVYNDTLKSWITKWDGADNTNFEGTKGGLSDSMKRAAVQWGIGRYLYNLDEMFVEVSETKVKDWNYAQIKVKDDKKSIWWKTPELPKWAVPKYSEEEKSEEKQTSKYETLFKGKTPEEIKKAYNGLPESEKGKNSVAAKEAKFWAEQYKSNKAA